MTVEDLDALSRNLLTKIREIKIGIMINSDRTKEDVEKALSLTDRIYDELYSLKLEIDRERKVYKGMHRER